MLTLCLVSGDCMVVVVVAVAKLAIWPLQQNAQGLAASKPVLPLVHRVTMPGSICHMFLSPPPFNQYQPLMALTVTPYTLLVLLPNLYHLSLDNILVDNAFHLALVNLARRRDIELYLTCCQVFIDTTPVSAFELRIVTSVVSNTC